MASYGFTKARSMGPVADEVERAGGSIAPVFKRAELPMRLIDEPERLILLSDQLNLVECAAREIADDAFTARLSIGAGITFLGSFGRRVAAAPRLDLAIACANDLMASHLQSSTQMTLETNGRSAKWTYRLTDRAETGRQKNEILALGYMLDLLRRFAGAKRTPIRAELPGPPLVARSANESILGCDISRGDVASLIFPAEFIEWQNPLSAKPAESAGIALPDPDDLVACVRQLAELALLDGRPRMDWLCRRLRLSRRTLQRRLAASGVSFEDVARRVSFDRSAELLAQANLAITAVGFELGYADPAHFTRAFRRWTGSAPRAWRHKS
jgi:AraC-like DNA-binding protein